MATESQASAHERAAQTYAPKQVAHAVAELLGAHSPALDAYIWGSSEEATIKVNVTPIDDVGNEEAQDTCAFSALVLETGQPAPIVLARPDVVDTRNLEGGSYGDSRQVGWEVAPPTIAVVPRAVLTQLVSPSRAPATSALPRRDAWARR
ncbi:hypothetical protein ACFQYP_64995 [Nonomuraea antimicrobica]